MQEKKEGITSKVTDDIVPVRSYLDQLVMPLLTEALTEVAKEKLFFILY